MSKSSIKPKFKKWKCEIIIEYTDEEVGDWGPRRAAINNLESRGFNVLSCASGWGQEVTKDDALWIKSHQEIQQKITDGTLL